MGKGSLMSSGFRFGARSERNLEGVNPKLVEVVRMALEISTVDFAVIEGLRTVERQKELYAQGRTKPGPKVTWTLKSKHIDGEAVDLLPVNPKTGRLDGGSWTDTDALDSVAHAMFYAAASLGVKIRAGLDWDGDGIFREKGETDQVHYELTA